MRGPLGRLVETMHVDRFCNLDTIGTSVKFGKIGSTGRTRKVDTTAEIRNQGVVKDVALVGWLLIVNPAFTVVLQLYFEPAQPFSSKDG